MATFSTSPSRPVHFGQFDITSLNGDYTYAATSTLWRRGPTQADLGTNVEIAGTGFTYAGGELTGGTITSISVHSGGPTSFQLTGISMSVATFNAYQMSGDSSGFKAEVFSGNDTISGSDGYDHLHGYAGNDIVDGKGGDDFIGGGDGADTLIGGEGNDYYVVEGYEDTIIETGKSTDLVGTNFVSIDLNWAMYDGIENVRLGEKLDLYATGDEANNLLLGNLGNNALSGQAGNDELKGDAGNDTLDGGIGADKLWGAEGNDTYIIDQAADWVYEASGEGTDTVMSSLKSTTLLDNFENLTLTATAKDGTGNGLANIITGNAENNKLDGKGGSDTLIGGDGNDQYRIDSYKDAIVETWWGGASDTAMSTVSYKLPDYVENLWLLGSGNFSGTGNTSANVIVGNGGNNVLDGGVGDDVLYGGAGNDIVIGGEGNDAVYGGAGGDTIDVSLGDDTVHYASGGKDVLVGFDGNATGGQDTLSMVDYFDVLDVDPEDRADRLHVSKNGTTVNVWLDQDGNGSFDFQIVQINTVDAITVGQDIVVA